MSTFPIAVHAPPIINLARRASLRATDSEIANEYSLFNLRDILKLTSLSGPEENH